MLISYSHSLSVYSFGTILFPANSSLLFNISVLHSHFTCHSFLLLLNSVLAPPPPVNFLPSFIELFHFFSNFTLTLGAGGRGGPVLQLFTVVFRLG